MDGLFILLWCFCSVYIFSTHSCNCVGIMYGDVAKIAGKPSTVMIQYSPVITQSIFSQYLSKKTSHRMHFIARYGCMSFVNLYQDFCLNWAIAWFHWISCYIGLYYCKTITITCISLYHLNILPKIMSLFTGNILPINMLWHRWTWSQYDHKYAALLRNSCFLILTTDIFCLCDGL